MLGDGSIGGQMAFRKMAGRVLSAILFASILWGPTSGGAQVGGGSQPAEEKGGGFLVGYVGRWRAGDAAMAERLGANTIREYLSWGSIEKSTGRHGIPVASMAHLRGLREKGIVPLVCLTGGHRDYDAFDYLKSDHAIEAYAAAFAAAVLEAGQFVHLWQVWNEWNLNYAAGVQSKDEYGSPEDYVRVLKAAYSAVKSPKSKVQGQKSEAGEGKMDGHGDPTGKIQNPKEMVVIGGNMALDGAKHEWLIRACRAGMLEHLDGLAFQPYWYWGEDRLPERGLLRRVAYVENTVRPFEEQIGKRVPFYITEWGWPTSSGQDDASTLDEQAKYIARGLLLLKANPRVRGVWLYELRDVSENLLDTDHNYGLLYHNETPKPSFAAFRDVAGLVKEAVSAEVLREIVDETGEDVWAVRLTRSDGRIDLALWAALPGAVWEATIRDPDRRGEVSALLVGTGAAVPLPKMPFGVNGGRINVTFYDMPLVIRGLSAGMQIESTINLQ
jgi:hypothetical protein